MKKLTRLIAVLLALTLLAAACGDDGGDDAGGDDGGVTDDNGTDDAAAGVAAAQALVDEVQVPPTEIGPTIPLDSVPEPKTVAWLECELPSCQDITPGFQEATELLGWNLEVIGVQSFDPAPGFQQAIDLGVDYVAITGTPPALIQEQIDAAADAGIAFFSCFDTTDPGQEANNIWTNCGDDDNVFRTGNLLSQQIIVDSGGTANVLMVNIPDFAVLVSEREGAEAAYAANCPGCTFTELPQTLDQLLAGDVPGNIVSAVQADPDIDYIHFAFDGLTGGVSGTLEEAGLLEGRNLVGVDFSAAVLEEIVAGTHKFWIANPKAYSAWLMVDGMARHAIGQENTEERANALLPTFIVDDAATAEPLIATNGWPGPDTMAEQFGALWGVG